MDRDQTEVIQEAARQVPFGVALIMATLNKARELRRIESTSWAGQILVGVASTMVSAAIVTALSYVIIVNRMEVRYDLKFSMLESLVYEVKSSIGALDHKVDLRIGEIEGRITGLTADVNSRTIARVQGDAALDKRLSVIEEAHRQQLINSRGRP